MCLHATAFTVCGVSFSFVMQSCFGRGFRFLAIRKMFLFTRQEVFAALWEIRSTVLELDHY